MTAAEAGTMLRCHRCQPRAQWIKKVPACLLLPNLSKGRREVWGSGKAYGESGFDLSRPPARATVGGGKEAVRVQSMVPGALPGVLQQQTTVCGTPVLQRDQLLMMQQGTTALRLPHSLPSRQASA